MCRAVTCRKCGKTTWSGCGRHVDQVMAGVPASRRCTGDHDDTPSGGGAGGGGLLRRFLGRRQS